MPNSTHIQETETTHNRKVPKTFESYFGNSNNNTNLVKYVFQKRRETLPYVLNVDGTADRITSQKSERVDFYSN